MDELDLRVLGSGMPGITPELGETFVQAASVCLEDEGHRCGSGMGIDGDFQRTYRLNWPPTTSQMHRSWADPNEATEHGACGIACLLVVTLTDMTISGRSWRETGFDFWLTKRENRRWYFQEEAKLEVSGIRRGTESQINERVRGKLIQIDRSRTWLPGLVVVVEFGSPRARMVRK